MKKIKSRNKNGKKFRRRNGIKNEKERKREPCKN